MQDRLFGINVSCLQLDEINEACHGHQNYVDVDTSMAINGHASKKYLTHSPFVVYFELGANIEGFWM
jgi:hypothetical protein